MIDSTIATSVTSTLFTLLLNNRLNAQKADFPTSWDISLVFAMSTFSLAVNHAARDSSGSSLPVPNASSRPALLRLSSR